ncbi:MAG: hypothetical protein ACOH18_00560 [Candidatus Saccharimonadaceae bacterium]
MIPSRTRTWTGTAWVGSGGPSVITSSPSSASRVNPTRGTYTPNSNQYAGLLPGWTPDMLTPVYANSSGYISISTPGPHVNKIFWGQVRMVSSTLPIFRNCVFAGPIPTTLASTTSGAIRCYGTGYYQWTLEDCLIDAAVWLTPISPISVSLETWKVNTRRNVGVHGGRGTMRRCEIKNVVDGVNSVQSISVLGDPVYENAFTLLEDCWIHQMHYYRDASVMPTLPEGTHSDCFQTSVGKHLTLNGCYLGGFRDPVGYGTYYDGVPASPDSSIGYNSGDDAWNSCMMIEQEVDTQEKNILDYVEVKNCFFEGGTYSINHHYVSSRPNLMSNSSFHNNYFVRRSNDKYVIRSDLYASLWTNNYVIDLTPGVGAGFTVGEPLIYTRG